FFHAYWRRPGAYLDARVRAGISVFARLTPEEVEKGVERLKADLDSGEWRRRNAELLDRDELDVGYRLLVAG
ncbi:MAG: SAM-dependent methyltransferase, partial [Thermoleophilaceae bacterium]